MRKGLTFMHLGRFGQVVDIDIVQHGIIIRPGDRVPGGYGNLLRVKSVIFYRDRIGLRLYLSDSQQDERSGQQQ